ncbi:MAG: hypothetical protein HON53_01735 [Planctomycetaceae bacterium]|jgi:hypothetical protein|nr:hypothetical protein [Planctomycetaceae bacterium]MBT6154604.1 hypothetical protein [Planctomycetaceae bacterium]MBT6487214.1 hypothetical protein [Planctomycetaceae bacterium]MBT6495162.1 hypothetical protein [Planctomycetaceae bacterium]
MDIARSVELAVQVSRHSDLMIESSAALPENSLRDFWKFSRRRITDWKLCLNRCNRRLAESSNRNRLERSLELESLISELLVSDVLTRLWSAILAAVDERRATNWAEPIARHVLVDHLQARYLALQVLVDQSLLSQPRIHRLNTLRHSAERWTDLLLGRLVCQWDVGDFAFDESQSREFGESHLSYRDEDIRETAWHLILSGARITFPTCPASSPWRTACLRKIIGSILSCFPKHALFQRTGETRLKNSE